MGPGQCPGAGYTILVLFVVSTSYGGNLYERGGSGNSGIPCGAMLSTCDVLLILHRKRGILIFLIRKKSRGPPRGGGGEGGYLIGVLVKPS